VKDGGPDRPPSDPGVASPLGITALDAALREGHTAVAAILRPGGAVPPARATPTGAYLGRTPPGATRRVFAPGFVSTERRELNAAFTPDGRTLFFSRDRSPRGTRMLMAQLTSDGWQPPVPAPFSLADDVDMFVSAGGEEVYFCSGDPGSGQASPSSAQRAIVIAQPNVDICVSRRQGDTWGPAIRLGPELNSPVAADYHPTHTLVRQPQQAHPLVGMVLAPWNHDSWQDSRAGHPDWRR
jgi:hypothetical protein